jgi:hypothetical protein
VRFSTGASFACATMQIVVRCRGDDDPLVTTRTGADGQYWIHSAQPTPNRQTW